MQELLQACQKCISGLLADEASPANDVIPSGVSAAMYNMHRPMLEYLRDEFENIVAVHDDLPAPPPIDEIHRIAAILAPVCPDVANALEVHDAS